MIEASLANPTDDRVRCQLAAWYGDHNDPDRAEYIRLAVEIDGQDPEEVDPSQVQRLEELEAQHRDEWLGSLLDLAPSDCWKFDRGLPQRLVLSHRQMGPAEVEVLARSPRLAHVLDLDLHHNEIGDAGATALANSPHAKALQSLDLGHNQISASGIKALATSPYLHNLTTLDLDGNPIQAEGAASLAGFGNLQVLILNDTGIGDAGLSAIAKSPYRTHLTHLGLMGNDITRVGADALAASECSGLTSLDLSYNEIGDLGAAVLATAPSLSNLQILWLQNIGMGDVGTVAVAVSPHLLKLRVLSLEDNNIGDLGATVLGGRDRLPAIVELRLGGNEIGDQGEQDLIYAFGYGTIVWEDEEEEVEVEIGSENG